MLRKCELLQMYENYLHYILDLITAVQSAGVVEYSNCINAEGKDDTPMSFQDMVLNHPIVSFGECGVPLHCHCVPVYSDSGPDNGPNRIF